MNTLSRDLLKELECPVCLNYLTPPIRQCCNGHNICSACKKDMVQCPTCREPFINTRNIALEKIAQGLNYSCINQDKGCVETFSHDLLKEHEAICILGPHECPMKKIEETKCTWNGFWDDFKEHVRSAHKSALLEMSPFPSSSPDRGWKAVFVHGEIFLYDKRKKNNELYCVMMMIGTKEQAAKFKSVFTVYAKNGVDSIMETHTVRSFVEDLHDIHNTIKCFQISDAKVRNFTQNNLLNMTVDISLI